MEARPGPRLENRLPAEGINSSTDHPLKEFAWLVGACLVVLTLLVGLAGLGAHWLAPRLPFSTEVALMERLSPGVEIAAHREPSLALQALAERVAARMDLPPGMSIVARYDDALIVNAYATLGGRIHVYRGLLRKLRSEDALAALLAHEIAHVRDRHVAANVGRGLAVGLVLAAVSSDAGAGMAQSALGQAAGVGLLAYSRAQEAQADAAALQTVARLYGHAGGVQELFKALNEAAPGTPAAVLRSHPLTVERLQAMTAQAAAGGWSMSGRMTALPGVLSGAAERP